MTNKNMTANIQQLAVVIFAVLEVKTLDLGAYEHTSSTETSASFPRDQTTGLYLGQRISVAIQQGIE